MGLFSSSTTPETPLLKRPDPVLSTALDLPLFNKLRGKRVVLASASPRRSEILETFGLKPEIVPSTFPETLSHGDFEDAGQYCVATGTAKAVEVYEKLVHESPEDPPDLVIGADTIVVLPPPSLAILEKPRNEADQMGMLQDYNGSTVSVITAVTLVQPQIATPGYSLASLVTETQVIFADNSPEVLRAYVKCGEGIDRAGGFAIQGRGGMLIKEIKGDFNNCVGFPGQAFFAWLGELTEEGTLCELD
ncbi:inosine triphosphate pyrophosphatase-like protein [Leucosporidium creatinivorum]|uniref:Inosine triphosphate pyrophosphatase-like protein n=1 Tax=Leucosporidium creatinivorum TaxID=106004 RepID=A0A1Y2E1M4_9BASI|nr:inosine triphosphate pyrophosphatase-like protein [Leucosporidium creatinivorum]